MTKILLVLLINHGTATYDAWTTLQNSRLPGVHESNPLQAPFSHSKAIYLTIQADAFLADYVELKHRKEGQRPRWFEKAIMIGVPVNHLAWGIHNQISYAGSRERWDNWQMVKDRCELTAGCTVGK